MNGEGKQYHTLDFELRTDSSDGLTDVPGRDHQFTFLGQHCFSEWTLLTSFSGFFSIPLSFCLLSLSILLILPVLTGKRPVQRDFRSLNQGLALQQARCAIRGI
jgi:hypothetical protein